MQEAMVSQVALIKEYMYSQEGAYMCRRYNVPSDWYYIQLYLCLRQVVEEMTSLIFIDSAYTYIDYHITQPSIDISRYRYYRTTLIVVYVHVYVSESINCKRR